MKQTDVKRLPPWLVTKTPKTGVVHELKSVLRGSGLHTVCESARCPNLGKCFLRPTATFLIMGDVCTRNCGFCAVKSGRPVALNPDEPRYLGALAAEMSLKHVVITSVTRDDLQDGGASHFASCISAVRELYPGATVEILTPDFAGKKGALDILGATPPEVFNHNLETVPRLYNTVRPGADYGCSLELLRVAKMRLPGVLTKSGLMLGLGETLDDVRALFDDLVEANVDAVTVGQYMRPTLKNLPVVDYLHPELFEKIGEMAKSSGILHVASAPLVRSSFNADRLFEQMRAKRRIITKSM